MVESLENLLGGGDILGELRFQLFDSGELHNVAQAGEEVNLQWLAIERIVKADQVDLDLERLLAERRIGADVDRRRPDGAGDLAAAGVNAAGREAAYRWRRRWPWGSRFLNRGQRRGGPCRGCDRAA